jgi:hypothetical protein
MRVRYRRRHQVHEQRDGDDGQHERDEHGQLDITNISDTIHVDGQCDVAYDSDAGRSARSSKARPLEQHQHDDDDVMHEPDGRPGEGSTHATTINNAGIASSITSAPAPRHAQRSNTSRSDSFEAHRSSSSMAPSCHRPVEPKAQGNVEAPKDSKRRGCSVAS